MKQLKYSTKLTGNKMNIKLRGLSPLFVVASIIVLMILLPSFSVIGKLFRPATETWIHIKTYLLGEYVLNSIVLVVTVGIITSIIGTFFSWVLTQYEFKYNSFLSSLLFLPMAIPPYIAGYIYGGIFGYAGTLERIMRSVGLEPVHIDMLSMGGAIFVFSLFLMPYVVLVTRSFFFKLPASYFESSRLLGKTPYQTFMKVILPLSRGAIIGGAVLVILEVLNDYGLVKYFGVPTFSTAIYSTWFGLGDVESAIRLASHLMIIVMAVLIIEHLSRGRGRISQAKALAKSAIKKKPSKTLKIIFSTTYGLYVLFSLIIPIAQLTQWSLLASDRVVFRGFSSIFTNTLFLSGSVTILVILCGLIIGNFNRLNNTLISKIYSRVVILGYSIPASIIAVAVMIFFLSIDRAFGGVYDNFGLKGLFLTSSIVMLIFALTIRFMAIGFNSIESGFNKMGTKYYEASKLLGKNDWNTFMKVDLPMLKPAIISAAILTFVDVLKELPLTLILRPFNFDTLATRVFTYAGDEMIHEASVYALIIIGVSVIALTLLQKIQRGRLK